MKKLILFSVIVTLIFIVSCKKENPPPPHVVVDTDTCVAGTGGSIDLGIIPRHHGTPIYGATVYIEFNTQSSPGSLSNYDLVVIGEPEENHIRVDNMQCGKYFIYCAGYDSTISQMVLGGIPYIISEDAHGDIDIFVPVTE